MQRNVTRGELPHGDSLPLLTGFSAPQRLSSPADAAPRLAVVLRNDPISKPTLAHNAIMIRQIQPSALARQLENGHTCFLLDVRQIWEHEQVALPNSVLIPLHELPQRAQDLPSDKNTPIVVYCHHGMRSLQGAAFVQQLGYTQVASLAGGIDAWSCLVDPTLPRYS